MKSSIIIFIILGLISCKAEKPSLDSSPKLSKSSEILDLLVSKNYNGSYLIKDNGRLILHDVRGYRDFQTKDTLKKEHQFYLASVSKQITSMACLMLVQRKQLNLQDPLSLYFPDLAYAEQVSIYQMLTHTSGIPDYYELGIYKPGMKNSDVYAALLKGTKLDFEPGSKYSYSNSAYVLLSMVVAKAAKQSFKSFVHKHIFKPLNMNQSLVYDESTDPISIRAVGFTADEEKKDYEAYTTGGGGIFSTTGDLGLWEAALYTDKLIPLTLLEEAYQPSKLSDGTFSYYGYGWVLDKDSPYKVFHTGSLEGFCNYLVRDLEKKRVLIFLTNNSNTELKTLGEEIIQILDKPEMGSNF